MSSSASPPNPIPLRSSSARNSTGQGLAPRPGPGHKATPSTASIPPPLSAISSSFPEPVTSPASPSVAAPPETVPTTTGKALLASSLPAGMEGKSKVNGAETSLSENNMDEDIHRTIYERGLEMRKKVVGEDYVARSLGSSQGDFMRPLIQYATEAAWGTIWTRPGLELKTRSLLNLVMLTALGKWTELGTHVRGAVRNGCSELEIREALLQATAYCGMPAGMESFRVADRVLKEMKEKGEM
ncbi:hypothetical protein BP5796_10672 [Coleophoma crateriformis]|uniref:Carboxymuconolactone decarboxylase-like domain-containing protein n=1 Tax=Coleophoma crateriformis TaxID=565419 RepID=A0A3D8QR98_9HELO|nr:hypothetical protein BP5796_10672 [Coleophoma crateriformis]